MAHSKVKGPRRRNVSPSIEPARQAPIPDPLGDDEHLVASGRLAGGSRDHQGLLGSGSMPLPDGGIPEHPTHDAGFLDDLSPEDYEVQIDEAPRTGFEPGEEDADEDTEPENLQEHPDGSAPPRARVTPARKPR